MACMQVAVQMLGACSQEVQAGEVVEVMARHDTYAMSFELQALSSMPSAPKSWDPAATSAAAAEAGAGGVGSSHHISGADPVWLAEYSALKTLNGHIGKAGAQDPLIFRRLARNALSLAARPGEFGIAPNQASALAAQFCS
ncbi:hypothetical protein DUNSADRAFT_6951 [Dunaliella salina]|uniref:Uncharacterized protein n=1 Tax=Dunaliella salina TaxID=3046 RepID=A0ABQ7GM89_DUNSA|nr:hypothetical protein DUNSADRAFT_6951 [Dunaliella salina]|eukprot:KAF5835725.1 hypothetical protein DUNSADRAFT_6951 [Dunaliella salina]